METLHFDARFIRTDRHDGISRFSAELAKALFTKIHVVAIIHDLRQLEQLPSGIDFVLLNNPQSPIEISIAKKLNKLGATHVFSPMQLMGSMGRKYKLILTLHDLIYYRHRTPPHNLNMLVRLIWRLYHLSYAPQRWLLNRSDAVVTVSRTTKKLMEQHRLTKRPVSVVYNAPELTVAEALGQTERTNNLIYMGSFMPYKNVETLVRGVGLLPKYTLHLLSRISSETKSTLERLAQQVGAKIEFHNGVSDQQYRELVANAFALVSASKDEGFGIPLVEAMQLGTPVVVSDIDIFIEVSQSAGTFFDPVSPESFANAVASLEAKDRWTGKSEASLSQAQRFDWNKSAAVLLAQFESLDS